MTRISKPVTIARRRRPEYRSLKIVGRARGDALGPAAAVATILNRFGARLEGLEAFALERDLE